MKKITGAYRKMLGQVEFHEQKLPLNNPGAFMPAVIVVGERNDEVPKAFTESEVRAMLDAVDAMEHFTGAQVQMLKEYGIFKDPS